MSPDQWLQIASDGVFFFLGEKMVFFFLGKEKDDIFFVMRQNLCYTVMLLENIRAHRRNGPHVPLDPAQPSKKKTMFYLKQMYEIYICTFNVWWANYQLKYSPLPTPIFCIISKITK